MTEENKKDCCGQSTSNECGHGHMKHKMMKKILVLIVLIMAFSLGVQIGELKGRMHEGSRNHRGMMGSGYGSERQGFRMMGSDGVNIKGAPTQTTQTPAKQ